MQTFPFWAAGCFTARRARPSTGALRGNNHYASRPVDCNRCSPRRPAGAGLTLSALTTQPDMMPAKQCARHQPVTRSRERLTSWRPGVKVQSVGPRLLLQVHVDWSKAMPTVGHGASLSQILHIACSGFFFEGTRPLLWSRLSAWQDQNLLFRRLHETNNQKHL